jgi:hypothetical protein
MTALNPSGWSIKADALTPSFYLRFAVWFAVSAAQQRASTSGHALNARFSSLTWTWRGRDADPERVSDGCPHGRRVLKPSPTTHT